MQRVEPMHKPRRRRRSQSDVMRSHFERLGQSKKVRDEEIVRLYDTDELSIREVAAKMKLADKTVMAVLHRAQDAGEIIIRPAARRTGRF